MPPASHLLPNYFGPCWNFIENNVANSTKLRSFGAPVVKILITRNEKKTDKNKEKQLFREKTPNDEHFGVVLYATDYYACHQLSPVTSPWRHGVTSSVTRSSHWYSAAARNPIVDQIDHCRFPSDKTLFIGIIKLHRCDLITVIFGRSRQRRWTSKTINNYNKTINNYSKFRAIMPLLVVNA